MDSVNDVTAYEDRRVRAMIDADIGQIEHLFAADLSWTHSSGSTDTREGFMEKLASGAARYLSIEREDVTLRPFGDTVLCSGITTMQVELRGVTRAMKSRYSNLWVRREDGWRMVHWQSTAIAA